MRTLRTLWLTTGIAGLLVGCTPTVQIATPQPIVINLNIQHEVRVKVEGSVDGLLQDEAAAGVVTGRGIADDARSSADDRAALGKAKSAGRLGERADGYVGALDSATPADHAVAERINAQRRGEYEEIAASTAAPREAVEAIAGERRLAGVPSGQQRMGADGRWTSQP